MKQIGIVSRNSTVDNGYYINYAYAACKKIKLSGTVESAFGGKGRF